MTEPTLDKLNQLINSYIEQYNLVESKERELERLKEQLCEFANFTIPKALAELGVARVKIDEGSQAAEFKPYREYDDPLLNPNDYYIRYWTCDPIPHHDPEITIEMEKPKTNTNTGMSCTDCPHYDSCSFKDYIDDPEMLCQSYIPAPSNITGTDLLNYQIATVLKQAPKDCPRFKDSKLADAIRYRLLYSVLFSSDATKEKLHRMPCEEDR